ncbi:DNA translocase FtsK [Candidatus Leptofilum sp.]|uniref:DNA translocase FtsK n=1 Tax=Candidatus Leptofilum sp. TaxID=3241576 RepID=UPI003B5C293B
MNPNRNELIAEMLGNHLPQCRLGIIIKDINTISPSEIASLVATKSGGPLYVAAIGDYPSSPQTESIISSNNIESAVAWRNDPELAGKIVVFLQGEVHKSHSLSDFDILTARDLTKFILGKAQVNLADNEPQVKFWKALQDEAATFPLSMIEDFVQAVEQDRNNTSAIANNMWKLGLLCDSALLDKNQNSKERLRRNRELIEAMGQLSEQSRRRIGNVLTKAEGADAKRLSEAFTLLKQFYFRGNRKVLQNLDFATVEQLLAAGRPLPRSRKKTPSTKSIENNGEYEVDELEKPLRGQALHKAIAHCVVSQDPESQEGLQELGEFLKRRLQNPKETEDETLISKGFGDQYLQPDLGADSLRKFIGFVCTGSNWGGILHTPRKGLKEAISEATPEDIQTYNPDDPAQGEAGHCLFSLLRAFDNYIPNEISFSQAINQLIETRVFLLQHLDLLLNYPFVLFGGYPEARQSLYDYLDAYSELLRLYKDHEATLHQVDARATAFIATELLRLDTVYIKDPDEWKAMLTPLHPLHLWRYREVLHAVHAGHRLLTQEEQTQLAEALPKMPHLLHYLVLSPNVSEGQTILPQAGHLETLPTYENHTNRYLGDDGVEFIKVLLRQWLEFAPYSIPQVRLSLVDVPSLTSILRLSTEFLKANRSTQLVIHSYTTRDQNQLGELVQLDFDNRDHDLAELMRTNRLTINLFREKTIEAVITSLQSQPAHITYIFDQSQYQVDFGPRARHLFVSPLVITYEYEYNSIYNRGTIAPSSEAEDGVFAHYHFLIERAASLPAGRQIRMQFDPGADLSAINNLLNTEATRWLAVADRVLTAYAPENGVPLGEKKDHRREVAVWAKVSNQSIRRFTDLLRRYNLKPEESTVINLLRNLGHIAAESILSISMIGGDTAAREAQRKGLLGKLLAAKWYITHYPGSLIASLDSNLAQLWLQARPNSNERADLIGMRIQNDQIIVEPIEVKALEDISKASLEQDTISGQKQLVGHAVDQIQAILEILRPIFGSADEQPLFTPARREVLKYQLYRECFREIHDPQWQNDWYQNLKNAFAQPRSLKPVVCQGMVIHIQLEENVGETIKEYKEQSITFVKLGTKAIQDLVAQQPAFNEREKISSTQDPFPIVSHDSAMPDIVQPTLSDDISESISSSASPPHFDAMPEPNTITTESSKEVEELATLFLRACQSYRIQIDNCDPERAVRGPNVWRFYVRLAREQKLDPLRNTLEDIGRQMQRSGLLINTIPNSDEVALDVPRLNRGKAELLSILSQFKPEDTLERMNIPIGVTPEGHHIIHDLGQMPHLLVGGTTGSGKTMFLYNIILGLLETHPNPDTLRMIISTSKPEDFSFFQGLPHLENARVVADAAEAVQLLQTQINQIFNERQEMLTRAHCRDIGEFNKQNKSQLPPWVIIVDEFADLADQLMGDRAGKHAFYTLLRRVAQLGRSRGVHLILCTQRPSADLVPTNIRNLMNYRVALRVNDGAASRMILDEAGAEQLQMHGDLLFKDQANLTRAQGYFVSSKELRIRLSKFMS